MWIRLIPLSLPDRRPIKYPYTQTCMDEMVCSKMEVFIALMGHRAGVKAHAAVFFCTHWDNVFQMLKGSSMNVTYKCFPIYMQGKLHNLWIPFILYNSGNNFGQARTAMLQHVCPQHSQFDGGMRLCKKLCDTAYACEWSEQFKVHRLLCPW